MRVGIGYDIHKLKKGRKLVLGGVRIPYAKGLLGHSDGDALLHAVSDAILGAASLGDIGMHFPNDDPAYKDARSADILKKSYGLIRKKGYRVNNVDTVVVAEKPRIADFAMEMKKNISDILEIDLSRVNIKATTNEGIGSIGKGEAIASFAVVTLEEG